MYMQTIFWRFDLPELCTESCGLQVLDTNDLAPNYFYDVFIKAYKCKIKKGFFPHGAVFWLNDGNWELGGAQIPRASWSARLVR